MKVTAMIPDELVKETQTYIAIEKLKAMGESINKNPLKFKHTAKEIREINRS